MRFRPACAHHRASCSKAPLAFALALALAASGCSRVPLLGRFFQNEAPSKGPIELTLKVAQENLRPGDAVIAYAWVRNAGNRTLRIQMLDASSVEFFAVGPGGTIRVRPVVTPKEELGTVNDVEPGKALPTPTARTFVFATLADRPGTYSLQAIYHPAPKGAVSDLPPVYSKAAKFKVEGKPSCRRDRDGILLKEDAIALARRAVTRPTSGTEALLLENDAGFLVWRVALTIDPKDLRPGEARRQVVYVNPYVVGVLGKPAALPATPGKKAPAPPPPAPVQLLPPRQQQ